MHYNEKLKIIILLFNSKNNFLTFKIFESVLGESVVVEQ
jgi:hypothetical protein